VNLFSCKQIAQAVSESFDHTLSWRQQLVVGLHLMMCSFCRSFKRQLHFLQQVARHANGQHPEPQLSALAKERLRQTLADLGNDPPKPLA
jgi:hypothetical protein